MRLAYASLIADDIAGLCAFYTAVLERPEVESHRTPIYRAIELDDGVVLAFSATEVYALLGMSGWAGGSGASSFLTFGVDDVDAVDQATARALEHGATLLHAAYRTTYGSYQAVLADPGGNVFRFDTRLT